MWQAQVAGWKAVTAAVKAKGGTIFAQLMHTGRVSHKDNMTAAARVIAPSAVALAATVTSAASAASGSKFANADVNKDKALSQAEACAGKMPRICKNFAAIDTNKDGAVTRGEIRAYKKAKRAARGLPVRP